MIYRSTAVKLNNSSYAVRLPVMGPFVEVFVYNRAPFPRKVSVWAYLVS
jgi:hypothetical protein